ncbi:DUF475 domain-containing protein [Candidatus Liberibacter africanus]|uniref:Integral membrane protein n=1 Tax=Candidatus Liberibacter africanus PTSAPSY TaxID=1277257 RepID=A0A0G3I1K9_LIBAF|nr:DUF475 domain-containing protein [Candidatus Liberibacter africanus]AKK19761.1 hypothetical protein G293_00575 [Candidatus Liberibacter africanus PTSAPSY]QTP63637.1 DUF475 domain-containing protein [Candidatus Liberibacter africanus]
MKRKSLYASLLYHLRWAFLITIIGILLSIAIGWQITNTLSGTISTVYLCIILGIVEISLSCDNAILNAKTLKKMCPVWQKRFLSWGILIAVFGMRIIFPIMIVCLIAKISPIEAINLAVYSPTDYLRIISESHVPISGFGGTFLMMVSLTFFLNSKKNIHWIHLLENSMSHLTKIKGIKIFLVLSFVSGISCILPRNEMYPFILSSILALIIFYGINFLENVLSTNHSPTNYVKGRYGLNLFLYLEIVDASLSFDGIISSFAITKNFFIIIIGLTIGAVYVRSMTLIILKENILNKYKYLEHGSYYSIFILSIIMFLQTIINIPEVFTGTSSALLILLSIYSSTKNNVNYSISKR